MYFLLFVQNFCGQFYKKKKRSLQINKIRDILSVIYLKQLSIETSGKKCKFFVAFAFWKYFKLSFGHYKSLQILENIKQYYRETPLTKRLAECKWILNNR